MLVIAWGLVLGALATWWTQPSLEGGWYTFQPAGRSSSQRDDPADLVVWLLAIGAWVGGAMFLLRSQEPPASD